MLYQGAGFLSAWDAFQASVPALQSDPGRFRFLGPREGFADLALAPFRPEHWMRPSTWVPLATLGALTGYMVSDYRRERKRDHPEVRWLPYSGGDLIFTGALSLNAGATEEAFFRGYLFPLFHQWSGERSWASNSAQGLLFALAHVGSVKIPVVQGFMGLYLGWMTERNGWTLGQAVCVHFWWDVITVAGALLTRNRISEIPISLGAISLPLNW
jgi:hypothetical protein